MLATLERPAGSTAPPAALPTAVPIVVTKRPTGSACPATGRRPHSRLPSAPVALRSLPATTPTITAIPSTVVPSRTVPSTAIPRTAIPRGLRRPVPLASDTPARAVVVSTRTTQLRMTVRARRLLVGLALLCCAAVGVVAVDVLSALVPSAPDASYAAQAAPYAGSAQQAVGSAQQAAGSAQQAAGSAGLVPSSGATTTVRAGDTLWSLAEDLDPAADPRQVIAAIMTLNDLSSPTLQPGQVLLLP